MGMIFFVYTLVAVTCNLQWHLGFLQPLGKKKLQLEQWQLLQEMDVGCVQVEKLYGNQ